MLYILQDRTNAIVPKEVMDSWATATKYLEELFHHDALRSKTWTANGILLMHLDGDVRIYSLTVFSLFYVIWGCRFGVLA
jgi:hypothetical protein